MSRKKKLLTVVAVIAAAVLLIPFPIQYKDGGTVDYKAILYTVRKAHSLAVNNGEEGCYIGTQIRLLCWEVYNDVEFVPTSRRDI